MITDFDIQNYRDNQLSNHLETLVDNEEITLVKCAACFDEVEETEIRLFKMHDINNGKELQYCKDCINIYKQENL